MESLTALREALRARWERRSRRQQLRRELGEYRTPAERQELEDICRRYDTTVEDLLAGREPPVAPPSLHGRDWERAWDEIVLNFSSDDE